MLICSIHSWKKYIESCKDEPTKNCIITDLISRRIIDHTFWPDYVVLVEHLKNEDFSLFRNTDIRIKKYDTWLSELYVKKSDLVLVLVSLDKDKAFYTNI